VRRKEKKQTIIVDENDRSLLMIKSGEGGTFCFLWEIGRGLKRAANDSPSQSPFLTLK
jgi:hypothetical protein